MSREESDSQLRQQTENRLTRSKAACAGLFGVRPMDVITLCRVDMTALPPGENADKTAIVICHGWASRCVGRRLPNWSTHSVKWTRQDRGNAAGSLRG